MDEGVNDRFLTGELDFDDGVNDRFLIGELDFDDGVNDRFLVGPLDIDLFLTGEFEKDLLLSWEFDTDLLLLSNESSLLIGEYDTLDLRGEVLLLLDGWDERWEGREGDLES